MFLRRMKNLLPGGGLGKLYAAVIWGALVEMDSIKFRRSADHFFYDEENFWFMLGIDREYVKRMLEFFALDQDPTTASTIYS